MNLAARTAPRPEKGCLVTLTTELGTAPVEFLLLARQVVKSGYVCHMVPIVLQTWLRHKEDFRGGVTEIIRCGGDTDTTAAILGAIRNGSVACGSGRAIRGTTAAGLCILDARFGAHRSPDAATL